MFEIKYDSKKDLIEKAQVAKPTFHKRNVDNFSISSVTPFPSLYVFLSYLSPSQSYYLFELQNQLFYKFCPSYQLQPNLVSELL